MRRAILCLVFAVLPRAAGAHPHVFIDAGVTFLADAEGRLAAVEVYWAYDELYSLLFLAEHGIEPDARDQVPPSALEGLAGLDAPWGQGFDGDLEIRAGETAVLLSGPIAPGLRYEAGRLVSHHIRALPERVDPREAPVSLRMFDPDYYVAYDLTLPVSTTEGLGCGVSRVAPDLNAAHDAVEEALYGPAGANLTDEAFPKVGALFAETVTLVCPGS